MQVQDSYHGVQKQKTRKTKSKWQSTLRVNNNMCALDAIIAFPTFCSLSFNHPFQ